MKKLLFLLLCATAVAGLSQNIHFIKSYGNNGYDFGRDIKQDIDTGYIATGSSSSFYSGNADAFLLKVDSLGNFKWSYNYGGSGSEWGEAVSPLTEGGYAIAGYTNSFGAGGFDFYFVKTNEFGVPLLEKTYGGSDWDKAYDMVQLPDSGFVMVGETYSYGNGNSDIYIVKIDQNGDTLWTRTYGGTESDYANALILDGDSIVVVGGTESFGSGMTDGIILKYHIDGTLGWMKTAGMEKDDYFTSITKNLGNEYFLAGSRHYYFSQTGYLGDFWIYNIVNDGTLLADTSLTGGSHEFEVANGIAIDDNDNIFFAGSTKSFGYSLIDGKNDGFVGRLLNNYYQTSYINNFGVSGNEVVNQLRNTNAKGYIAIGDIETQSTGGNNLFILKIDKDNSIGNILLNSELEAGNIITLSAEPITSIKQFKVFPSLATDRLFIEGEFDTDFYAHIIDMNGKKLQSFYNQKQIDLQEINSGYYILRIITESGVYSAKFLKQN
jgi:hypothetical protein